MVPTALRPAAKLFFVLVLSAFARVHADDVFFGMPVPDKFRGLEISSSPTTQAWQAREDQAAADYFSALPGRARWRSELQTLTSTTTLSLPKIISGSKNTLCGTADLGLAQTPHQWDPSPDGRLVVYGISPRHQDAGELHVRDLRSKKENPLEILPWENYGDVAWSADSRGFYYLAVSSGLSDTERVAQATVRYHRVGQSIVGDAEIFPATQDSSRYLTPQTSVDGQWLFISVAQGFSGTQLYARDLTHASTSFQLIFASTSATASVTAWNHRFYLLTNANAPHYAVWISSGPGTPWQTLLPEPIQGVWESINVIGQRLLLQRMRQAASELVTCTLSGTDCQAIRLPAVGSVEALEGHPLRDDFYFQFESFVIPPAIYKASIQTRRTSLWRSNALPKIANATIEHVGFTSKDGTRVPLWLLYSGSLERHRRCPAILAGYGGFGVSMTPRYQAFIGAWLKAGGLVAVPMLRGGGEFGETWHAAGMRLQKQHTFDDMIAAAEFLIKEGYTTPEHLALQGGSNGGLTVAAVITQRPDLFRAAILKNPLTDMIRYPLFGEGPAWISEYGSPKIEDEFHALLAYSPDQHVTVGVRYPAVLMLSAEADDRVDPLHARKFTALLQAASASQRPIIFKTLKKMGHAGADSAEADIEEWTDRLLFLQHELVL